jgi:penicillin-binding protein 1A
VNRRLAIRAALFSAVAVLALAVLALVSAVLWYGPELPTLERVTDYRPRQPLQVFTQDGVELAQFGSERRQFMRVELMPQRLKDAVLAVEDWHFREHRGISVRGLARAFVANLTGGVPQGASTITQQVARTFFLSTRRTPERKIKEALLALQIEKQLNKDQILELYLNQIYLGQRAYGFAAASSVYFGKPLGELSIAETAMLAGLPQNPIYANPITNAERARKRQLIVLGRMRKVGLIDEAAYKVAAGEKLAFKRALQVDVHAEHVAEMARRAVFERFGERAYNEGFRVHTSLRALDQQAAFTATRKAVLAHDRKQPYRGPEDDNELPTQEGDLERAAAQALKEHRDDDELRVAIVLQASPKEVLVQLATGEAVRISGEGLRRAIGAKGLMLKRGSVIRVTQDAGKEPVSRDTPWSITQWPEAEAAFVALDPRTGRVRALVGGFDFQRQPFNHVTHAWRQPGSSFKPFLYSAALEERVMPDTLINDAPLTTADGGTPAWNPKNSDGRYDGALSLRDALARSKNMVSIRVLQQVGLARATAWSARFGFDAKKQPDNLTFALGAGSVTPLQVAGGYAVLANGGHRVTPVVIERITDAKGTVLFEAPAAPSLGEATRVLPARNVFITNTLLAEVTRNGTASRVTTQLKRSDLYGKTGTTNDAVDAWFAGFHPSLVAVAWIGHDEPRSLGVGESGGGLALPAWIDYMARVLRDVPVAALEVPEGVSTVATDSGQFWRYAEWAEGGSVQRIGLDEAAATAPAAAASQAEPGRNPP